MNIKPLADRVLILPAPAEGNGTESRRPSIVWQILGYRNRTRRCEIPDYAPKRCTRNPQLRIKNQKLEQSWQKKYFSILTPATN